MKTLPSRLFPNCELPENDDVGFYDIIPEGFNHEIYLYLSKETVADDEAVKKSAEFFDKVLHWDTFCREIFLSFDEDSEEHRTVKEYFAFYKEEIPEVFNTEDISALSLADMVNHLKLQSMASHESGDAQNFVVDFTLGYDQILCVKFNNEGNYLSISWES